MKRLYKLFSFKNTLNLSLASILSTVFTGTSTTLATPAETTANEQRNNNDETTTLLQLLDCNNAQMLQSLYVKNKVQMETAYGGQGSSGGKTKDTITLTTT